MRKVETVQVPIQKIEYFCDHCDTKTDWEDLYELSFSATIPRTDSEIINYSSEICDRPECLASWNDERWLKLIEILDELVLHFGGSYSFNTLGFIGCNLKDQEK